MLINESLIDPNHIPGEYHVVEVTEPDGNKKSIDVSANTAYKSAKMVAEEGYPVGTELKVFYDGNYRWVATYKIINKKGHISLID